MKGTLASLKDYLAFGTFGMTYTEAKERVICLNCKKKVSIQDFPTEADVLEWSNSALCPVCFDKITTDPEEEGDS